MDVIFYYENTTARTDCEVLITGLTIAISKIIKLPDSIEVCFYPLVDNFYGGLDKYKDNRIGINYNLSIESIPKILTHELIHVHQKHKGFLRIKPDGSCYWRKVYYTNKNPEDMSHEEYMNLPWESDAYNNQDSILRQALELIDKK